MAALTVVATIIAKPEHAAHVKQVLLDLIPLTRVEQGCLRYELQQELDAPHVFTFVESWASRDLHSAHMQSPHLLAFPGLVDGEVERWDIKFMEQIG